MFIKVKSLTLVCLFNLISILSVAQQNRESKDSDSLRNDFLIKQSIKLQELENARMLDSLKKEELEYKLKGLSTIENVRKEELLKELRALKNKDSMRIALRKQKIDSLRQFIKGYPVVPFLEDTLFYIYNKQGSFSPKERSEAIAKRINGLAEDYFFNPDSIKINLSEMETDIYYRDIIIMNVSQSDAIWENTSKEVLAKSYKTKISEAVIRYQKVTSWQTIAKEIALALLVIGILSILIFFIGKLFERTQRKIENQHDKRIKGIKIGSYQLLDSNKQLKFFLSLNKAAKWFVIVLTVYLTLPVLFSIFPWTERFSDALLGFFLNPLKKVLLAIWNYLPNLFSIIVIALFFHYTLKMLRFLKIEVERGALKLRGFYPDWAHPTFQIVQVLVYAFMLIVIFPYLPGSDSPIFKGVSVFIGVLFTFGSAGALSNVVSGLVLTYMRAFKIGDRVQISNCTGDIIEKSLLVTRILTIKNEIISIPNSTVMTSQTINYSGKAQENGLILNTTITIGYDAPWRQVHQLLIDAALSTSKIENEPKPFVLQTSLNDFYVSYQINAYTKESNKQAEIYSHLHQNIQDRFNEAGVEIMSPHYNAFRDGNHSAIPLVYLPKNYKAPGYRITKD